MNLVKIEVRPNLAITAFIGAVAPLFFWNTLTIFVSICLCIASAILFRAFVIIPFNTQKEYVKLQNRFYRSPPDYYRIEKSKVDDLAYDQILDCYKFAGFLYIVGLFLFVILHFPS
jgi:hypothetical protein